MQGFDLSKVRMVGKLGDVAFSAEIEVTQRHVAFMDQHFADLVLNFDVLALFGVG